MRPREMREVKEECPLWNGPKEPSPMVHKGIVPYGHVKWNGPKEPSPMIHEMEWAKGTVPYESEVLKWQNIRQ